MQTAGVGCSRAEASGMGEGINDRGRARGRGHSSLETTSKRAHPLPSQLPFPGMDWRARRQPSKWGLSKDGGVSVVASCAVLESTGGELCGFWRKKLRVVNRCPIAEPANQRRR
jgi:hypothetical protein